MTNVDVAALAAELAPLLVGARLDKAYQPAKEQVLLRLRRKGAGKQDLLIELGRFATLTRRPPQNPDKPSMVAQILRTTFENSRLTNLQQVGFDRLLRLDFERGDGRHSLVVELFGDGNLLVLDADGKILLPMRGEDHGARKLRKGEPYQPPPGSAWPFDLDGAALQAKAEGSKDLVRFLALGLGFGPLWAEELCLRAGLDKRALIASLDADAWKTLQGAIAALGRDLRRNDLAPAIVHEDGRPVDAVPFVMAKYPAPRFTHEEAPTFREALDVLFVGAGGDEDSEEPDDPRRPRFEEARGKVAQQLRMMDEAIAAFVAKEKEDQLDGDALYASFGEVQAALDALNKARLERSWTEIEETLAKGRAEGNPFARKVVEVRPHAGIAVLALSLPDGTTRKVAVDLRRTVQENAEACYAAAKKSRSRREGAETARKDAEARLRAVENAGLDAFGAAPVRAERQSRHFWFEGYRWALTPSGFLAVGGRNGGQNDQVVKKYLRDGDRYVHADVHGAPSVVVRPADGPPAADIPAEDLRVACQFAVCASRAWRQGGSSSAYWVTPAQVSKTPRSGEYVPRGAWMIHGKRNTEEHLPLEWAVGLVEFESDGKPVPPGATAKGRSFRKLAGGPPAGLRPFATDLLRVMPGTQDPNDAAAALAERYGVGIEEALAALPAGPVLIEGLAAHSRSGSGGSAAEDEA